MMNKRIAIFLLSAASLSAMAADWQSTFNGLTATCNGLDISVTYINPATIRIVKTPEGYSFSDSSLVVLEQPQAVKLRTWSSDTEVTLGSDKLRVTLDLTDGKVSFSTPSRQLLTSETLPADFRMFDDNGRQTWSVGQSFSVDSDEAVYGLGILQNGKMSQRGVDRVLVQENVVDIATMYQSVKGYGIYWDNYSPTRFRDNGSSLTFDSEIGDCMDYYFMYGGNADGVIALVRQLTGDVPMAPLWAYGFMQSRERYTSQDELVSVIDRYRSIGVPLDVIIQDWQYWSHHYLWNAMDFLADGFPDPQRMTKEIHERNAKMMISVWPNFGPMTIPYRELDAKGHLYGFKNFPPQGNIVHPSDDYPSGTKVYDAFSPEARDIYWKNLKRLYDAGVDGWWLDATEPDSYPTGDELLSTQTALGTYQKVRNAYPLASVEGVYNSQRAESDSTRVMILTRSFFMGQQRTGANTWSGDVNSTWEDLRNQLPNGLNFTMTGNPAYNSDIGGFFAGNYNRRGGDAYRYADFQELYTRWMQLNVFNPMMRSHGTSSPREIFMFGESGQPIFDAQAKAIRLRYDLLPYIYSTAWDVSSNRSSFMRPLVMDFAADKRVHDMNDEFMFGKALLVAPILNEQYTSKGDSEADFSAMKSSDAYLPAGTVWWDWWTEKRYQGGQTVTLETDIASIPLFARAGAIVPIGPEVQYSTEKPWDNLTIRVFPGANGEFTLYEDEFDNYNYEKGAFTEIPMKWNNGRRTLTIGTREGSYLGMIQTRKFTVVLPDGTSKTVSYNGKKVSVKL